MSDQDNQQHLNNLRDAAERTLQQGGEGTLPDTPEVLRHELSVHQIELQLQNDTLRETVLELEQARDRAMMLYEFAPVGYISLDVQSNVTQANARAINLLGVRRTQLVGRRLTQFTAPESRTHLALVLPRLLTSEDGVVAELSMQRQDGSVFPVRLEGRLHPGGGSLLSITDISQQKAAQDELLRLNETLENRIEERTAKIRELGDELRTVALAVAENLVWPLRRVATFAQMLRQDTTTVSGLEREHFDHVVQSVDRMEALTAALLEYIQSSQGRARVAPLDLNRVFGEVRRELEPRMAGRTVQLTSGQLPTISGDLSALRLVFLKVLENALKFTTPRERAQIHVSAEETASEWILRFEDNGVGFNNRHKDKLFQVFKRLHPESEFPGTGMGLAIVRRVSLRFGARVWGEGKAGSGATVYVAWPKEPSVLD
ncbi:sensor histidine kinase [Deinococcus sonorensis]|uniref:histidine kinase n=2 Tax=Deinococcus sonorensis TaxID=309891 RepID=A0AAU7UE15_9DEIO